MQKKYILISIIILFIILLIIVSLVLNILNQNVLEEEVKDSQQGDVETIVYNRELLSNSTIFYTLEDCINTFLDRMQSNEKKALYDILNEEYISKNSINEENILEKLSLLSREEDVIVTKAYEQKDNKIYVYIVETIIDSGNYNDKLYFIVEFDDEYLTYNIMPINNIDNIENIQYTTKNEIIKANGNNKYNYNRIKDNKLIEKYLNYYIKLCKNNNEKAFELIEKEYKDIRFSNIQEFNTYIKNMPNDIRAEKYAVYKNDDYKQFVCIDNYGNYYIINERATMQFSIILDTYTIEIPQFVEKYNQSNEEAKVALNINKFISGINDKNYNYSYSILADSFKNNKYKNIEIFKQYIKQNLFEKNKVEFKEFSKQGSNYIYKINILNEDGTQQKDMTIIMKLNEGIKFEMSFSIN